MKAPRYELKTVKNWDHKNIEVYLNGMLYSRTTEFFRKDAFSNLYEFGIRVPINMKKIKLHKIITKEVERIHQDTLTVIWGIIYGFSIFLPLFGTIGGWFTMKDLPFIFIPFYISMGLYLVISHENWSKKLTHYKKESLIEDDG